MAQRHAHQTPVLQSGVNICDMELRWFDQVVGKCGLLMSRLGCRVEKTWKTFAERLARTELTAKKYAGKHASEESSHGHNGDEAAGYETRRDAMNKMELGKDRMKQGAGEMKDNAMDDMKGSATDMKHKAQDMAGRATDKAGDMKDKANDMASKAADRAGDMKDKVKDASHDMKESAARAADEAEEGRSKVAEMAKAAKDKTMDAAEAVAEKTKQTVAGAWDAAKGTSQKIKDTVVGTSSDDEDDWGHDDRTRKPKVMDEDVKELRRKVGNLDHEKKDY